MIRKKSGLANFRLEVMYERLPPNQRICDPFTRLRHEVALKSVTADNNQDVTQCSAIGTLPRRAAGATRRYEALGTM
jgi:hypothetical protein